MPDQILSDLFASLDEYDAATPRRQKEIRALFVSTLRASMKGLPRKSGDDPAALVAGVVDALRPLERLSVKMRDQDARAKYAILKPLWAITERLERGGYLRVRELTEPLFAVLLRFYLYARGFDDIGSEIESSMESWVARAGENDPIVDDPSVERILGVLKLKREDSQWPR